MPTPTSTPHLIYRGPTGRLRCATKDPKIIQALRTNPRQNIHATLTSVGVDIWYLIDAECFAHATQAITWSRRRRTCRPATTVLDAHYNYRTQPPRNRQP